MVFIDLLGFYFTQLSFNAKIKRGFDGQIHALSCIIFKYAMVFYCARGAVSVGSGKYF